MKALHVTFCILVLLVGCQSQKKKIWKDFIPGMYATTYSHSYSVGKDTLKIILNQGSGSNNYTIIRHNSHQRIINGKVKPAVTKRFVWSAMVDEKSQALIVLNNKRILVFEPALNQLQLGTTVYKKIK